jgi:hypothetical protein
MNRRFGYLIAAFLLLCLPLQGVMASAMLLCKSSHHGNAHHDNAEVSVDHSKHEVSNHSENLKNQCSACSVCCNLSSLPTVISFALEALAPSAISLFEGTKPPNLVLEGPKRPPRFASA